MTVKPVRAAGRLENENRALRERILEIEAENATLRDYLREVAVEAGLPPETLDIASCRHIAHQVKAIREASITFMNDAATLREALKNHAEEAAKMVSAEPVAIYHGTIDCGETGAFNLEILRMIPHGAKLYTEAQLLAAYAKGARASSNDRSRPQA